MLVIAVYIRNYPNVFSLVHHRMIDWWHVFEFRSWSRR